MIRLKEKTNIQKEERQQSLSTKTISYPTKMHLRKEVLTSSLDANPSALQNKITILFIRSFHKINAYVTIPSAMYTTLIEDVGFHYSGEECHIS